MTGNEVYLRIEELFKEINSKWIKVAARQIGNVSSWTRQRKMPLCDMLICTLSKKGLSTTMELRQYFQAADKTEKIVSKQDYLKQRQKLNPEVFRLLNQNYLKRFYEGSEVKEWEGYLIMAIDGTKAEIPNSEENRRVYGKSANGYGDAVARASLSTLYDINNRFILDIGIHHYCYSEIDAAKAHIDSFKEIVGDRPALIIFDRGYVSLELMEFLEKRGIKYLIRLSEKDYKAELSTIKETDEEVELFYTKSRLRSINLKSPERAKELETQESILVRIVKTRLENGDEISFVTNLRDGTSDDIDRLYLKRWFIEQKYNTLKNKLKFESVTGKASIYVAQDFWAQTLVFNMVQDLITGAEYRAVKKAKEKQLKYKVRINENIAIGLFKEQFIRLMLEKDDYRKAEMFRNLTADMERNILPIRKLKSAPRKWKYYNKYDCNLKPAF